VTSAEKISVNLYNFDNRNYCLADITLSASGVVIRGFKVRPGNYRGSVHIQMPSLLHNSWPYSDISWSDVCTAAEKAYSSEVYFNFYSLSDIVSAEFKVYIASTKETISGIWLTHKKASNEITVGRNSEAGNSWQDKSIDWEKLKGIIIQYYHREILKEDCTSVSSEDVNIEVLKTQERTICFLDIKLPHKAKVIKGFVITTIKDEVKIAMPKWMRWWDDEILKWHPLCDLIKTEYEKYIDSIDKKPGITSSVSGKTTSKTIGTSADEQS